MSTATPFFMNYAINSVAKKSSALTEANEQSWRGIPGYYDIGLYWKHYMYNVTNFDDVVFRNAKPEFMEFGPYIYQEYDTYDNLTYTQLPNP